MSNDHVHQSIPDHPLIPKADTEWIETNAALAEFLDHVREIGLVAYDTEFIGESSYWPYLCLVQLSTPQRVAVVDALAEVDLTPIWELLADASVRKLLHAGQQDLEPVVRHLDRAPANVFDTQVASGFAALPYPLSLRRLLDATIGVRLPKALTFTSWDARPISAGHLRYAADDVRYLPAVAAEIEKRLATLGHTRFAEAACAELCEPDRYRFDPIAAALRIRGAKGLAPALFAVLVELIRFRDEGARTDDSPPRTFLRDEVLIGLARKPAKTVQQLNGIRGMPQAIVDEHHERLIEICTEARKHPLPPPGVDPDAGEVPAAEAFRADGFWAMVQAVCLGKGVDPSAVLARQEALALQRRIAAEGIDSGLNTLAGWRRELLGPILTDWLTGRSGLELTWNNEAGLSASMIDSVGASGDED